MIVDPLTLFSKRVPVDRQGAYLSAAEIAADGGGVLPSLFAIGPILSR